jgi:ParB family transcriptional regulator, chromosome partitioning protein
MALSDNSLGRSLSDVFAKTVRREQPKGYLEIDLGMIVPPSANPRTDFDSQALEELAASLKSHGMLQPIVVMKREVGYEVLSGERRYRAAKLAGLTKVPVVVREENDPQHQAELRLIENIQRENLNAIELAKAYQALIETHGLTHDGLADRLNKERSGITNNLRLLGLPEELQTLVSNGSLSMGHARALVSIADNSWQRVLAQRVIDEGLSVRDVERLAKGGPVTSTAVEAIRPTKPPHLRELETNLFHLFGTRVTVKERGGKGSMTLHFESKDHFQRVVAIMDRIVKQSNTSGPAGG